MFEWIGGEDIYIKKKEIYVENNHEDDKDDDDSKLNVCEYDNIEVGWDSFKFFSFFYVVPLMTIYQFQMMWKTIEVTKNLFFFCSEISVNYTIQLNIDSDEINWFFFVFILKWNSCPPRDSCLNFADGFVVFPWFFFLCMLIVRAFLSF